MKGAHLPPKALVAILETNLVVFKSMVIEKRFEYQADVDTMCCLEETKLSSPLDNNSVVTACLSEDPSNPDAQTFDFECHWNSSEEQEELIRYFRDVYDLELDDLKLLFRFLELEPDVLALVNGVRLPLEVRLTYSHERVREAALEEYQKQK